MQLQPITTMFHKRMNRKQFLQTVGLIALTIVGLNLLFKNPSGAKQSGSAPAPASRNTYGG